MVSTAEMMSKGFESIEEYEMFRLKWIRICSVLNAESRNSLLLMDAEKRAEIMGIVYSGREVWNEAAEKTDQGAETVYSGSQDGS